MTHRVYFDNAAGTPIAPEVLARMNEVYASVYGNPSSIHADGMFARNIIEDARRDIATVLACHADELLFVSGGTEGNNGALLGAARAARAGGFGNHIVISAFEHQSVLAVVKELESEGFTATLVAPNEKGLIDETDIEKAITDSTVLVSVMYANNEIGTVQPIAGIAKAVRHARRKKEGSAYPLFHTDACQATGNLPLSVIELGVDMMTLNSHKAYGPAGVGVVYVKRGVTLAPIIFGGGQERGIRSGTENVAAIAGAACAIVLAESLRAQESVRLSTLRDYCVSEIQKQISDVEINGDMKDRLPGNVNISIAQTDSEQVVVELDAKGISISSGSACTTSDLESSYVILSLGKTKEQASSAVRFSFGRHTTKSEIDTLLTLLPSIIHKLRRYAPKG